MAIVEPFDTCDTPNVLFGTGTLYLGDGTDQVNAGNFSLADFLGDGTVERYFHGADEFPSVLGITASVRLVMTGDSFSVDTISRLLNEVASASGGGRKLSLTTVRPLEVFQARFVKDVSPPDCDADTCLMEITLWRAYCDLPSTLTFSQDEQAVYVFNLIALPDAVAHPLEPFGQIEFSCPAEWETPSIARTAQPVSNAALADLHTPGPD